MARDQRTIRPEPPAAGQRKGSDGAKVRIAVSPGSDGGMGLEVSVRF
jgi:hypothetical protein